MTIDTIRMFPMVRPSGYPQTDNLVERKMLKQQETARAELEQKKVQHGHTLFKNGALLYSMAHDCHTNHP